jgi:hypothetical protein
MGEHPIQQYLRSAQVMQRVPGPAAGQLEALPLAIRSRGLVT